jgi:hypothetical protein
MQTTEFSTQGFLVNMTLEKPPWGKPVEEEIYYGVLEKYYSKEIDKRNLITIANSSQAWQKISPRRMSPLCLEVHTLALGFAPLTLDALLP